MTSHEHHPPASRMVVRQNRGYQTVNIVQGGVVFGKIGLFSRLLQPDENGRYALVLATTQLVQMAFFTWVHAGMARFYETARGEGRLGRHFATGYLAVAVLCVIVGGAYVAAVGLLGLSEAVRTALFFVLPALLPRSDELVVGEGWVST